MVILDFDPNQAHSPNPTMNQHHTPFLILLLTCILFQIKFTIATEEARLNELNYLRRASRKGLITFTTSNFREFLEVAPRSYGIILLMTAPNCAICPSIIREMERITSEYANLPSGKAGRRALYFAKLEFSRNDESFLIRYQLRHVPILHYFPASRSKISRIDENSRDNYPVQRLGIDGNSIRQFVNTRCGTRLKMVKGNYKVPFVGTVRQYRGIILLLILFIAIAAVYTGVYTHPMFWFSLVVLVYIFSVGGGHYSWIHDVPFVFVNKNGVTEYIAAGSRSQYVAEGFFVSVTCVSISVLAILINELPNMVRDKDVQTFVGIILFVLIIFAITALVLMYYLVSNYPSFLSVFMTPEMRELTPSLRKRLCVTENAGVFALLRNVIEPD